jgi:hypothetical protein
MPYTVTRDDDGGPWEVAHDGVVIETARANWDVDQVLEIAEAHAGTALAWKLIDGGGFESLGSLEILRRLVGEHQALVDDATQAAELPGMWEQADLTGGETDR